MQRSRGVHSQQFAGVHRRFVVYISSGRHTTHSTSSCCRARVGFCITAALIGAHTTFRRSSVCVFAVSSQMRRDTLERFRSHFQQFSVWPIFTQAMSDNSTVRVCFYAHKFISGKLPWAGHPARPADTQFHKVVDYFQTKPSLPVIIILRGFIWSHSLRSIAPKHWGNPHDPHVTSKRVTSPRLLGICIHAVKSTKGL